MRRWLCARVACPAWSRGPSTSPLEDATRFAYATKATRAKSQSKDPSFDTAGARGPCARSWVTSSASAALVADAAAVKGEVPLRPRAGFALRKPRAHSRLDEGVL